MVIVIIDSILLFLTKIHNFATLCALILVRDSLILANCSTFGAKSAYAV